MMVEYIHSAACVMVEYIHSAACVMVEYILLFTAYKKADYG